MPRVELSIKIQSPIETVFDLARSIDLHTESTAQTNEVAVAGVTSGLIELGESVTWEATHFFVKQQLTAKIVAFDRPNHFRDSMVQGIFKHFDHDHFFEATPTGTVMRDVFEYSSPFGVIGQIANFLLVDRHMRKLLVERNKVIKRIAESNETQTYLNPAAQQID